MYANDKDRQQFVITMVDIDPLNSHTELHLNTPTFFSIHRRRSTAPRNEN